MAKETINIFEELKDELSISQTDVNSVLKAIDKKIIWYSKKINNPKYKAIVPIKTKELRGLKTKISEDPNIIKKHADVFLKRSEEGTVFGISFGTKNCCIARVNEFGVAEAIYNLDGSFVMPSVVEFEEGGSICVGISAKESLCCNPQNVCCDIRRYFGSQNYSFEANGEKYTSEVVAGLILKKLTTDASEILGQEVKNVVLAYPTYFGMDEKQSLINSALIAGLNVLGTINEPTAAALSYGMQDDNPQTAMVYDLGGGSFDISILKTEKGVIQFVAVDGDGRLGGEDWDNAIRDYTIKTYCELTKESPDSIFNDEELMGDILLKAERAKKLLTSRENAIIRLNGEKIPISQDVFEQITQDLLEKTIIKTHEIVERGIQEGITILDKILLVGGSTIMPQVWKRLKQEFPNITIEFSDPDQSVAKGAAIYGLSLENSSDSKEELFFLQNSIALKMLCSDNKYHILNQIYGKSVLPIEHHVRIETQHDNQRSINIELFENGSDKYCIEEKLGYPLIKCDLFFLPSNLPKRTPVDICIIIDNGYLKVEATCYSCPSKHVATIKIDYFNMYKSSDYICVNK